MLADEFLRGYDIQQGLASKVAPQVFLKEPPQPLQVIRTTGRARDPRRQYDILKFPERVAGRKRESIVDVESRSSDPVFAQHSKQGRLFHQLRPGRVQEHRRRFEQPEMILPEDPLCSRRAWESQHQVVEWGQELFHLIQSEDALGQGSIRITGSLNEETIVPSPDGTAVHHPDPQAERAALTPRSEERRVGKECRSRWSPYH